MPAEHLVVDREVFGYLFSGSHILPIEIDGRNRSTHLIAVKEHSFKVNVFTVDLHTNPWSR